MTHDDVLTGYRRRLFTLAEEIGVRPACRAMGVHHSTYYRLKSQVDRFGPRGAATSASAAGRGCQPDRPPPRAADRRLRPGEAGLRPRRISAELEALEVGRDPDLRARRLARPAPLQPEHPLKRLALVARHADPYEQRPSSRRPSATSRPSEPGREGAAGLLLVGRLRLEGEGLAIHRRRRRLGLHLGRASLLGAKPAGPVDGRARPPGRPRAEGGRLEAQGGDHR